MNPLITTDEVRTAELLTIIDGTEYYQLAVVYKLNGNDTAAFYCSASDWPQTEAGRIARYVAEIERLKAENALLRDGTAMKALPVLATHAFPIAELRCPHCPERGPFQRKNGLNAHMRIKHGE